LWARRPRLPHTTSQNHCSQEGRDTIGTWLCTRAPTSRRCGHARRRSTPTPRDDAQATHTQPRSSRCVPFSDPHVHKVTRSNETRQGCTHSSANTLGTIPPSREDTPSRRQVQRKRKEGGSSTKSSVLTLTCVPLPHLVLPLSGWPAQAPRQWQHEVRQGDTHDSGAAAFRVSPCQTSNAKLAMAQ